MSTQNSLLPIPLPKSVISIFHEPINGSTIHLVVQCQSLGVTLDCSLSLFSTPNLSSQPVSLTIKVSPAPLPFYHTLLLQQPKQPASNHLVLSKRVTSLLHVLLMVHFLHRWVFSKNFRTEHCSLPILALPTMLLTYINQMHTNHMMSLLKMQILMKKIWVRA